MRPVFERQRARPKHIRKRKCAIEMRKLRPAARYFPFQIRPERCGVTGGQNQAIRPREMLRRGFPRLGTGGEMNKAIGKIDRRAGGCALGQKIGPFGATENLEYQHAPHLREPGVKVKPGRRYPYPWGVETARALDRDTPNCRSR